ncbi:DNA-binding MarR family transcriptional regulator [Roseibium hamelinense]|uniref:DNA-binding MarR family transcriptional regulator n=1 Tax=Roseibium hamelinense TaxID=150831 RepID=A0A562SGY0_9HYPH|nr:MarR family winged helix-turn-helix transcriptional regulator [Roseibium hamelinense]MTI44171.1 MarR family transcriptional regulator [Roseibium hamelinense]TWI80046.1 DNA-binding MarR family transcriptional regulator [Roseibium hamelinense]
MSKQPHQMSLLGPLGVDAETPKEKTKPEDPGSARSVKKAERTNKTDRKTPKAKKSAPKRREPKTAADGNVVTLDQFLCFSLYSATHAMHRVYKPLLQEIGLTYPQYLAMVALWEKDNVPVNSLTDRLQLETNTVTPLLKRLESMDLLTRTRSQKDERQVTVKLTRRGKNLRQKCAHFAGCVMAATGLEMEEIIDLQSRIMTLRDQLRAAGH